MNARSGTVDCSTGGSLALVLVGVRLIPPAGGLPATEMFSVLNALTREVTHKSKSGLLVGDRPAQVDQY